MQELFVDISQWQAAAVDWQKYKQWSSQWDGISRVAMRSSYGVGYTDENFAAYRAGALAAGITQIIYYHYAYPQYNSATKEALWQQVVVGNIRPTDMLALDIEENVPEATQGWVYVFLTQQQFNYPSTSPRLYASSAYITERLQDPSLAKYPLWLANWQFTPDERPPCPPPWSEYEFVQYTDRATIPGIPGTVDADIFIGKEPPPMQQPTQPTASQQKAADDSWKSVFEAFGISSPRGGTGIYQAWIQAFISGTFYGPPLSREYNAVDWNGNAIVVQEFAHARCEWNGSSASWYSTGGKIG